MSQTAGGTRHPFGARRHYLAWAISPMLGGLPPDRRGLLARVSDALPLLGDDAAAAGPFGDLAFVGDAAAAVWDAYLTQGDDEAWPEKPDAVLAGWHPSGPRWRERRVACFAEGGRRGRSDREVRAVLDPFERAVARFLVIASRTPASLFAQPYQPDEQGRVDLSIELAHLCHHFAAAVTALPHRRVPLVQFGLSVCPGATGRGPERPGHERPDLPEPPDPLLTGWQQLITVINRGRAEDIRLRNVVAARRWVIKQSGRIPSPITFPGRGGQPHVRESALLVWLAQL